MYIKWFNESVLNESIPYALCHQRAFLFPCLHVGVVAGDLENWRRVIDNSKLFW